MIKIIYTKHALKKFDDLAKLEVRISKRRIEMILNNPLKIDTESDCPNIIATGVWDKKHSLRVIYGEDNDIILIITFYPTRKERCLLTFDMTKKMMS